MTAEKAIEILSEILRVYRIGLATEKKLKKIDLANVELATALEATRSENEKLKEQLKLETSHGKRTRLKEQLEASAKRIEELERFIPKQIDLSEAYKEWSRG